MAATWEPVGSLKGDEGRGIASLAVVDGHLVVLLTDGAAVDLGPLPGGGESSATWSTLAGKPTTFPPSAHNHTGADITDLTSRIQTAVSALVAGAPGALDTLDELAAAMGDDPNFATTVVNLLAQTVKRVMTATDDATTFIRLVQSNPSPNPTTGAQLLEVLFGAKVVTWLSEFGHLRLEQAVGSEVLLKLFRHATGTADLLQVYDRQDGQVKARLDTSFNLSARNIGTPIKAVGSAAPDTSGWTVGWLWYDTTGEG